MRIKLFIVCISIIGLLQATVSHAEEIDLDTYQPLVSDVKSYRLGEPIVVFVLENTSAESEAATGVEKSTFLSSNASDSNKGVSAGLGVDASTDGAGKTVRRGKVRTQLSALIVEVLPNNLLKVEGRQNIAINGEKQSVSISGIVRAKDITKDNSIFSYQLANVELELDGKGVVTNAQRKNIFSWVLGWLGIL